MVSKRSWIKNEKNLNGATEEEFLRFERKGRKCVVEKKKGRH